MFSAFPEFTAKQNICEFIVPTPGCLFEAIKIYSIVYISEKCSLQIPLADTANVVFWMVQHQLFQTYHLQDQTFLYSLFLIAENELLRPVMSMIPSLVNLTRWTHLLSIIFLFNGFSTKTQILFFRKEVSSFMAIDPIVLLLKDNGSTTINATGKNHNSRAVLI